MITSTKDEQARCLRDAAMRVCDELSRRYHGSLWFEWSEDALWFELVACILGSRVPYEMALGAAESLKASGLLDTRNCQLRGDEFQERLVQALSQAGDSAARRVQCQRYRFPYSRARYIRRSLETIRSEAGSLLGVLARTDDAFEARRRIVSVAVGIGPKQASLFLRNVGYASELAILDSHILQYMATMGLVPSRIGPIHTMKHYERIEGVFRRHARSLGFLAGLFDVAVWIVMRVAKNEPGRFGFRWA